MELVDMQPVAAVGSSGASQTVRKTDAVSVEEDVPKVRSRLRMFAILVALYVRDRHHNESCSSATYYSSSSWLCSLPRWIRPC